MAVVATGFFDGVHLGHRLVIRQLVDAARAGGDESVVVTFWPHPRTVLQDGARSLRLLNSLDEKKALLKGLGVDRVEVLRFTREFAGMDTETYLRDVIVGQFGGKAVLLGYDNRIGSDQLSPEETGKIAEKLGLKVIHAGRVDGPEAYDGPVVSSTVIRNLPAEGNVDQAAALLGYEYSLHGVVVAGNRYGRRIGFPTANMQLYEPLKLVPANGVYLVAVETLDRKLYGMCNIGVRPTVGSGNSKTIETNIFDFDEDIYGLDIRISFIRKLRDEILFPDLESLGCQLKLDRDMCLAILGEKVRG